MRTSSVAQASLIALALAAGPAAAQHDGHHTPSGDSAAVVAVITKYHAALAAGDSAAALELLTHDAVILESGGVETRDEYRLHHLPADINHAKAVHGTRSQVRVQIHHDIAWTASTSSSQGEMNGRAINSVGAEMMVLVRTPSGWKISAIHWSSRQRRAG